MKRPYTVKLEKICVDGHFSIILVGYIRDHKSTQEPRANHYFGTRMEWSNLERIFHGTRRFKNAIIDAQAFIDRCRSLGIPPAESGWSWEKNVNLCRYYRRTPRDKYGRKVETTV